MRPPFFLKYTVHVGTNVCHGTVKVTLSRLIPSLLPACWSKADGDWEEQVGTQQERKHSGNVMVTLDKAAKEKSQEEVNKREERRQPHGLTGIGEQFSSAPRQLPFSSLLSRTIACPVHNPSQGYYSETLSKDLLEE